MGKRLLGGPKQITVALATVLLLALFPSNFAQIAVLAGAGLLGLVLFRARDQPPPTTPGASSGIVLAVGCLALFAGLLIVGPFLAAGNPGADLAALGESFYRVGALVFGGGHVVLPLLKEAVVTPGWVLPGVFMAGYGFAQAVPGPLFSLSAFLGFQVAGWWGAVVALTAIFLPSFLLVAGVLPFWSQVRSNRTIAAALTGVNAAVVGLLAAAFYDPIGTLAIKTPTDFSLALALFALLEVWKVPTWAVVLIGLAGAGVLSLFGL
jgi:chromate transporter